VPVILALPEGLSLAVAEAESAAVAPALGLGARVALCVAEVAALALLRAVLDTAQARVTVVEALGGAPLGVLVAEGFLVLRGVMLLLEEVPGRAVDVTLLVGLSVVLAVEHSVSELLSELLKATLSVSVGVALPVLQAVADKARLEVKKELLLTVAAVMGDAVAAAGSDAEPAIALSELLGVREVSGEAELEGVAREVKLAKGVGDDDDEREHPSTLPP
jgi:hypothetical protein